MDLCLDGNDHNSPITYMAVNKLECQPQVIVHI